MSIHHVRAVETDSLDVRIVPDQVFYSFVLHHVTLLCVVFQETNFSFDASRCCEHLPPRSLRCCSASCVPESKPAATFGGKHLIPFILVA